MPVVSAARVSPTWAVPVMVGAPVAGVFGPGTTSRSPPESIQPSSVQMAPSAVQSVVTGSTMVAAPSPSGSTWISQPMWLGGASRCAPATAAPVTVKAWSRRVL